MIRREPSRSNRSKAVGKRVKTKKNSVQGIEKTLAELDALKLSSPKMASVVALFRGWLTDDSGYDEETWPKLKKALNRERSRIGARRLFDA